MENFDFRENNAEYEISIKDIFKTFKQGFWVMLVTAVAFAAVAFGYFSIFVPKSYTADVKFYVETAKRGDSVYADINAINYAVKLKNTFIELLETGAFRERLSDDLDNKFTPTQLSSMVKFVNDTDTESEVFKATVTAASPTEAKIVADSVAEIAPQIVKEKKNDTAEMKVVDTATIPSEPSSPNVSRNTMLAFAAGFVIALIYVFVREALDNKVKYNSEMNTIDDIPVLSAIPDFGDTNVFEKTASDKTEKEAE